MLILWGKIGTRMNHLWDGCCYRGQSGTRQKGDLHMFRIIIPIDGTERSLRAVDLVKMLYLPEEADITLLNVQPRVMEIYTSGRQEEVKQLKMGVFDIASRVLAGYKIKKEILFGTPAEKILSYADETQADIIMMTKSTRDGWKNFTGSVAAHVMRNAGCFVMFAPEKKEVQAGKKQMKHMSSMSGTVTLKGQMNLWTDECLLPVREGECTYKISVKEGRLRFNHLSFDTEDCLWNLPPHGSQRAHYELREGMTCEIAVDIAVVSGRPDQIKIVNPSIMAPLTFEYQIWFSSQEERDSIAE